METKMVYNNTKRKLRRLISLKSDVDSNVQTKISLDSCDLERWTVSRLDI